MGKYATARAKNCTLLGLPGAYNPGVRVVMVPLRGATEPKVRFGNKVAILVSDTEAYSGPKALCNAYELGDYLYS